MIGRLEGVLRQKQPTRVLVDVGGVGYEVWVPLSTFASLPDEGKVVSLRIHTHVREDALVLFGFASALERDVFERLLGASRVGPKLALAVLSGLEARPLVEAVRSGDVATLSSVPGVGRRMAERIVVELRDRMTELELPGAPLAARPGPEEALDAAEREALEQILSALLHLGVPRSQAEGAARRALEELGMGPIETLIRAALRGLSR